jgi:adenine-specific DNA-methyltransferase
MPILDWLNKEAAIKARSHVPYRLLKPVKKLSYGDPESENMLIQGDNLEALKALLPLYAGQVKCIYIDPPYNTQSAFEHYDDNLEHSTWLSMIYPRLELLRELLAEDGSIWVSIDDHEGHYLKVIMDEVFGRQSFVCDIAWEKRYSPPPDTKGFGYIHDHIICYRKSALFQRKMLPMTGDQTGRYKNQDNDSRGPWKAADYTCRYSATERPNLYYPIEQPFTGELIWPSKTRVWAMSKDSHERNVRENRLWWGKTGKNSKPALKNFFSEINQGMMPMSIWKHTLAGHTQDAMKEMLALFGDEPFGTPKPEKLLNTILTISTDENDIVLDSFLGSGTTAAVAHKMGRRYIGIEMGDHAETHCQPRLRKVIDGEQGGISKAVEWQGGGGFTFYRLGETVFDEEGRINPEVRFASLAAHLWFSETGHPWRGNAKQPFLGIHDGTAYALLYNGILGDRSISGGNVLTRPLLTLLRRQADGFGGPWVVYGEMSRITPPGLQREGVTFKQTPYDIKAR